MQEEIYVKENKIIEKNEVEQEVELIKVIIKTRQDLKNANKNFEYASEDLVDYYTYQIKANQAKLDYLIKLAKSQGLEVDMIKNMMYKLWSKEEEEAG